MVVVVVGKGLEIVVFHSGGIDIVIQPETNLVCVFFEQREAMEHDLLCVLVVSHIDRLGFARLQQRTTSAMCRMDAMVIES